MKTSAVFARAARSIGFVIIAIFAVTLSSARSGAETCAIEDRSEADSTSVLIKNGGTINCPLKEGESTFIVAMPSTVLDGFTFVNENSTAVGELKIFVSNEHLSAASSKWVAVDGSVRFSRKRQFNLSMLGIDARYVKLAFTVDKALRLSATDL